ncbi:DUF6152 family protein [Sphingomonas azotifigens]|uniref:DUF6152 family protein n=1 Tax=Sphingomonas azotifigens TaxID=330920 RepID=UPI00111C5DB7|nr:DUF6152 family protein [Sphingomonas azotifigens]
MKKRGNLSVAMAAAAFGTGLVALAAASSPALAHHSFAMFDQTKILNAKGTISEFHWTNPHSFIVVDVKTGATTTRYVLECNSTNMMTRAGWKVNTVKPGDAVGITYYPLRTGKPGGMLKTVTLADGKTLSAW